MSSIDPKRGEIWTVNFDPTVGHEIKKARPAIIVSIDAVAAAGLRVAIPITGYKDNHDQYPWCVPILPTAKNGLSKKSTADALQIKCVSLKRFIAQRGTVSDATLRDVSEAVALLIGT